MNYYVGIDASLDAPSLCVVDGNGTVICEGKVARQPGGFGRHSVISPLDRRKEAWTRLSSDLAAVKLAMMTNEIDIVAVLDADRFVVDDGVATELLLRLGRGGGRVCLAVSFDRWEIGMQEVQAPGTDRAATAAWADSAAGLDGDLP